MNLANNMIIDIYSIAILIIICFHSSKQDGKESLQHRLYMKMIYVTLLMLVMDILSRFNGRPGTIYPFINHFGNFMIFLLNPIVPSLWLFYVNNQVFPDEEIAKRLRQPLFAINAVNGVMLILTQFFGWYYYIDSNNIYHRGPLFLLSASITIALVIASFALTIVNRKKIEKKYYCSLIFFAVPPFVGIILQILFYGTSPVLNTLVLSLLIVFSNFQNHDIHTDYLTGVNNRKKLEAYLKKKINTSTVDKTFSAIMIDLDKFKSINDTFGHEMGDTALQISAKLIRSCLRSNDLIARYGGDEFFVVLDISDKVVLEEIVFRINSLIKGYNKSSSQPYEINFSMGYDVYDYYSFMKPEEFQRHIDKLMYKNKNKHAI